MNKILVYLFFISCSSVVFSCTKSSSVDQGTRDSIVNIPYNSWQFMANGQVFSGPITGSSLTVIPDRARMNLSGLMASNSPDTTFSFSVQFGALTLDTGVYFTSMYKTEFLLNKSAGDTIFASNPTRQQVLTVHVISYDDSSKEVNGTFSGDSYDFSGNDVPITNGAFRGTVY